MSTIASANPTRDPAVDWLRSRAAVSPTRLALLFQGQAVPYGELDRWTDGVVHRLWAAGVRPGTRVAALLPNSSAYVVLIHAAARLGAVLVPLNTRLTASELAYQIDKTTPRLLITDVDLQSRVQDASCPLLDVNEVCTASPGADAPVPALVGEGLGAPQAIVFTSGTTGHPKGVVLSFANHFWSATASSYRLGILPTDRWLSCLPLYHVGGLAVVFRSCLYGTGIVLHERFDLERFDASLDADGITLTSLVPTMFYRLLEHRQAPWPPSLRAVLLGGAATSPALVEAGRARQIPMSITYGMTEAASQVATARPDEVLRKPGCVGKPLMFASVRIADADGESLPTGEIGEVLVRGPMVMQAYFEEPAATARALRNGELYTGDMGYLDEDGDLWIVQRRSDIIVSGGENVYPAEVEAVLDGLPGVHRSSVVGLADEEWGQIVAALVEPAAGPVPTADLLTQARQRLAGYKVPRLLVWVDELPQTASGKIERRRVAEILTHRRAASNKEGGP